jgi:hypothetical protein
MSEDALAGQLGDFLERLGRAVETPKPNRLVAKARTALIEEETQFNVVESADDGLLKRSINVVAPGLKLPQGYEDYDRVHYFDDFLDSTVDSTRLSQVVLNDPSIQEERAHFIPQRVSRGGTDLGEDATQLFRRWLRDDKRRLLAVLAPAGYGKTALTCELTHQLASDYLERSIGGREPFPFLIPFGEFRRLASFEGMILQALERQQVLAYTSNAFAYLIARGRAVLILDGFDELLEERPEDARQNLRELIETLEGSGKVLITARSTFFRTSDEVAEFLEYELVRDQVDVIELKPFDLEQRRELIAKRVPTQAEIRRVGQFVEAEGVEQAMGSPLLLSETIEALTHPDASTRLDPAAGRQDLFRALEGSIYERERVRQHHDFSDDEQRLYIQLLAGEMLRGNDRGYDRELIEVAASEAIGRELSHRDLEHLADHHFLHAPHSDLPVSERPVHFNHQVFREYFQARALLEACRATASGWIHELLVRRPLPEEVCNWCSELDTDRLLPLTLLNELEQSRSPSQAVAKNTAALCSAYSDRALIERFLAATPAELPLSVRISELDLSESDWSGRYIQELELTGCDLRRSRFEGSSITELTINRSSLEAASFANAAVQSIAVNAGERIFGPPEVLTALERLGADCGVQDEETRQQVGASWRDELKETIRSRLRRFYVPGLGDTAAGSRWKGEIQEKNLLGGLDQAERKWIKSKVIPKMISLGILSRRSPQGMTLYLLTNDAEDDARALIERGELIGLMRELVDRLE